MSWHNKQNVISHRKQTLAGVLMTLKA